MKAMYIVQYKNKNTCIYSKVVCDAYEYFQCDPYPEHVGGKMLDKEVRYIEFTSMMQFRIYK